MSLVLSTVLLAALIVRVVLSVGLAVLLLLAPVLLGFETINGRCFKFVAAVAVTELLVLVEL